MTDAFSGYHPFVNFLYFVCVLVMTMSMMHPVYLLLSLLCSCLYLFYLRGTEAALRRIGYLLPLLLFTAILNPLFNHEGMTILWYLPNDNPITLEAIIYGLAAAVMMGAAVVWFNCLNEIFTSDKIMYLFGRLIPSLSLLLSMTLRFVPRFKNYLQSVRDIQREAYQGENREAKKTGTKLQDALSAFSATVSWAMEQSIISSDSMKSRGYGLGGRTAFSFYRFEKRDGFAVFFILALTAGAVLPYGAGITGWIFYPRLEGTLLGTGQLIAYACYAAVCMLPLLIDLTEDLKWKSLR